MSKPVRSRPLRVLLVSHRFAPDVGGIETMSELIAEGLATHYNVQVTVVTHSQSIGEDSRRPFEVIRQPQARTLWKAVRAADVVFHNNICMRFLWPQLLLRRPLVVAVCTWVARSNGHLAWQDRLKRHMLNRARAVISVSQAIAGSLSKPSEVVPNCYRDDLFVTTSDPSTRDPASIVFLGRLVSDKGADIAIRALGVLRDRGITAHLTIVGEGPERGNLQILAIDLDLVDRIRFCGTAKGTDLVSVLNQHAIMVVPSRWAEPFGLVALEGLAAGCLIVASNQGGLPEAVGSAGLIFESPDSADLAQALETLILEPQAREELRSRSHDHLQRHSSRALVNRYYEILDRASLHS